jgi:hypothetical protein
MKVDVPDELRDMGLSYQCECARSGRWLVAVADRNGLRSPRPMPVRRAAAERVREKRPKRSETLQNTGKPRLGAQAAARWRPVYGVCVR